MIQKIARKISARNHSARKCRGQFFIRDVDAVRAHQRAHFPVPALSFIGKFLHLLLKERVIIVIVETYDMNIFPLIFG